MTKLIQQFVNNPRRLFVVDGIGAILSAFLLGVVLLRLEHLFGIPASALYVLASLPIVFALFDFYCYHFVQKRFAHYFNILAIVNLGYCCLSIGFAAYHSDAITSLGWLYILIEILIVIYVARIELKVAKIL